MATAAKRKKKAPARPAVLSFRRIVVAGLAIAVFMAALILNTEALITLPIACAAGACGHAAQWIVRGCSALAVVAVLVAIIRRWHAGSARRGRASDRRTTRKAARKPAAPRQSARSG